MKYYKTFVRNTKLRRTNNRIQSDEALLGIFIMLSLKSFEFATIKWKNDYSIDVDTDTVVRQSFFY